MYGKPLYLPSTNSIVVNETKLREKNKTELKKIMKKCI